MSTKLRTLEDIYEEMEANARRLEAIMEPFYGQIIDECIELISGDRGECRGMGDLSIDWTRPIEIYWGTQWHPAQFHRREGEYAVVSWVDRDGNLGACSFKETTVTIRNVPQTVTKRVYLNKHGGISDNPYEPMAASVNVTFIIGELVKDGEK